MILNDKQIRRYAMDHDMIVPYVETLTEKGIISYGPSTFGYDVRIGYKGKIFTNVYTATVDPKNFPTQAFVEVESGVFTIPPNSFMLAATYEIIKMPRNVTGLVMTKSTYARCGISCPPTVLEAGWEGQITLEIINSTPLPALVYGGEGIAQVVFFEGEQPELDYGERKGKYQGQRGITLPEVRK